MQTLKELLAEIEELRSQLAVQDKKPRTPGKVPAGTTPKSTGAAPTVKPSVAPAKMETWSPGRPPATNAPVEPSTTTTAEQPGNIVPPVADTGSAKPVDEAAAKSAAGTQPGKITAKAKADAAAREKAQIRLKEIVASAAWHSARYAAASALDEKITDTDLDASLGKLRQQITTPSTLDEGLDDAKELVRAIRNKVVWKDEKSVPEERKSHVRKAEQLLVELMDSGDEICAKKIALLLYDGGTRSEIRMAAGRKLGQSETDILFKEWTVRGRKLEKAQIETIYNNTKDWRQKWLAGKELAIPQAYTDVYENKEASREDRLEASHLLGLSHSEFALHERELGKDPSQEDLKHIWIGAKDHAVRIAAAKELGHSSAKIWMSEHPVVVVGLGILVLIIVGTFPLWRPRHHSRKTQATNAPVEQVQTDSSVSTTANDTPSSTETPMTTGTTTQNLQTSDSSGSVIAPSAKPPDYNTETIDMAGMLSRDLPDPSTGSTQANLLVAPPDLPEEPEDIKDTPATPPTNVQKSAAGVASANSAAIDSNKVTTNTITSAKTAVATGAVAKTTAEVRISTNNTTKPAIVAKSTNVVGIASNKVAASTVVPARSTAAATGQVTKAIATVKISTNVPNTTVAVKATNLVGTASNKVPTKVTVSIAPTGQVSKAVAPARVATNTPRPTVAVTSTNATGLSSNKVPATATGIVTKAVSPGSE